MRAVAYLSHALALRQAPSPAPTPTPTPAVNPSPMTTPSSIMVPDNSTCAPERGTPGSVFICGTPGDCAWWEYTKMTKDCRVLGGSFQSPSLVGPDYGGHCHLYTSNDCKDGEEVVFVSKPNAPLPVPTKPTKITCPGITGENIPQGAPKAIKCYDKLDHPSTTPTTPSPTSSAVPAAVVQTPPAGCTSPALAGRQNTIPTPDYCKCVPGNGHPGAVYMCKNGATSAAGCEWFDYERTKNCASLDMMGMKTPYLIGPDFGGYCQLYTTPTCDEKSEVWMDNKEESKKIVCPGRTLGPDPSEMAKAVAIKCFDS